MGRQLQGVVGGVSAAYADEPNEPGEPKPHEAHELHEAHEAHDQPGVLRFASTSWAWWPGLRFAVGLASLVFAVLGLIGLAWMTWGNVPTESYAHGALAPPPLQAAPPVVRSTGQVPGSGRPQPDPAWVDRTAGATGIPARALTAYAQASLLLSGEQPACRVGWTTLAGLGRIESDHGTLGGTHLLAHGRPAVPIVGPALDGRAGFGAIRATPDSIALDGDPHWAHAIGPMQFIPSTWHRWASDGDGDGRSDPNDVDDAAYAAARYLCASGADLTTDKGWQQAIHSYNHSDAYTAQVLETANRYAGTSGKG